MSYEDDLKLMECCEKCRHCELDPTGRVQGHYCQMHEHELGYIGISTIRECDWYCEDCGNCDEYDSCKYD